MTLTRTLSFIVTVATLSLTLLTVQPVSAASPTVALSQLQPGTLVRGTTHSAVYYYGADGFRYVFANDKVYGTWYSNFDSVKWLTDGDLAKVQMSGNVTYRPGTRMIKINSDPKVYAVGKGGTLHWVSTESVAIALYGSNWNKQIDDVPDGLFSNYTKGSDITEASQFVPASVTAGSPDINADKSLQAPTLVTVGSSMYSPASITIQAGRSVKWVNNDSVNHAVTSDDLSWGSGTMTAGITYIRTFKTPGTYTYFDSYKPQLTGTIIVQ